MSNFKGVQTLPLFENRITYQLPKKEFLLLQVVRCKYLPVEFRHQRRLESHIGFYLLNVRRLEIESIRTFPRV